MYLRLARLLGAGVLAAAAVSGLGHASRAEATPTASAAGHASGAEAAPARSAAGRAYRVEIRRTSYGIPHVTAQDYASLAYGVAYAYAQDNVCILADRVLQVNGERSRYFGPGSPTLVGPGSVVPSIDSDFFYKSYFDGDAIAASYAAGSREVQDLAAGYAAGYDRYLRDTGVDALPEACRGAPWVRPITERDVYLLWANIAGLATAQNFASGIAAARPPSAGATLPPRGAFDAALARSLARAEERPIGSNALALGRDVTENGTGMLLGNPHFPWMGTNRFYEVHVTIPGRLDAMGVALGTFPVVSIGFNRSLAWSHTISTGSRATFRELALAAGDPTAYVVDGVVERMTSRPIPVDVRQPDGTVRTETRTLYASRYGPIVVFPDLGMFWGPTQAYAYEDANLPNNRLIEQWLRIDLAGDVGELQAALESVLGVPWVNTIAADADGNAFYADISVKADVSAEKLADCTQSPLARIAWAVAGLPVLDGSRTSCDWSVDPTLRQPGIMPPSGLPSLVRSDYVANGNNSHWLANPLEPLTGFSPIVGSEGTDIGLRARLGLVQVADRLAGRDGFSGTRYTLPVLQGISAGTPEQPQLGFRNLAAEMTVDAIVGLCSSSPTVAMPDGAVVDLSQACAVLAAWDRRDAFESVGAHVFKELWTSVRSLPALWAVPFDPADPVHTPRELDVANSATATGVRQALGAAVLKLRAAGVPLTARWGELQFQPVNGRPVPVAGGDGEEGVYTVVSGSPLGPAGYAPIVSGTSYIQTVTFDRLGPIAEAVLLYGQSTDPASPYYFDQLEKLWARRAWYRLPFSEKDIARDPNLSVRILAE